MRHRLARIAHHWRHRPALHLLAALFYAPRSTVLDWWAERGMA